MENWSGILVVGEGAWRLGVLEGEGVRVVEGGEAEIAAEGPGPSTPAERAAQDRREEQVARGVKEALGGGETRVVLTPRAGVCFSARLEAGDAGGEKVGSRAWRRAMTFALEEKLPLAAEDVVADFAVGDGGVLGVCAPIEELRPWVEALEAAGVGVAAVTPAALLALQGVLGMAEVDADAVLVAEGDELHLFVVEGGKPVSWHRLPNAAEDVLVRLSLLGGGERRWRIASIGAGEAMGGALLEAGNEVVEVGTTLEEMATRVAAGLLADERRPMIDLRRDALAARDALRGARSPAIAASSSMVGLLVVFCVAMLLGAWRAGSAAERLREEQRAVYRELMPGSRVPETNVARRLASDQQALAARAGSPEGLPGGPSALVVLRDVLERLPRQAVFRIDRVNIDSGGDVEIQGQTRSHQEAALLRAGLEDDGLFVVPPARTNALRQGEGVSFTLRAVLAPRGNAGLLQRGGK